MPAITALISRSKLSSTCFPLPTACSPRAHSTGRLTAVIETVAAGFVPAITSYCGKQDADARQRLVGALQEFDGHEDHLLVAEILEVMDLELAGAIGLVPGLAGRVGIFDRGAVVHVLAPAAAGHGGPEIVEHVPVEADALAGLEANGPHADAIALRYQRVADTGIGVVLFPLEFCSDLRRPRRFHRVLRLLVQHR